MKIVRAIPSWFGDFETVPAVVVEARSVEDVVRVMRDEAAYPAPVRAVGSRHSTTRCGVADGGTVVLMRGMDRILEVEGDRVTAEAGALYIDISRELARRGLQFFVNTEIGNLTIGSAASCGTKDASLPGECGQVSSYVVGVKLVVPGGAIVEVTEADPELLRAVRSSYGLFGIVVEATLRLRPLAPLVVRHRVFDEDALLRELPELLGGGDAVMMYMSPFIDRITVELRRYGPASDARDFTRWQWALRNWAWAKAGPWFSYFMKTYVARRSIRYALVNAFYFVIHYAVWIFVRGGRTLPADQTIRYPPQAGNTRYTFSFWAFPESRYADTLREYLGWARDYYRRTGYRTDMPHVAYRIARDDGNLLSYSRDEGVITIDPVSTGNPGWPRFLADYNEWCANHGGIPLLNQSDGLTRAQLERALGDRLARFHAFRRRFDPTDRMLNPYFRELLGTGAEALAETA